MLSKQIRSESTIPHKIITTEFTLPPMLVEAHFQQVVFINRIHIQSQDRYLVKLLRHPYHSMSLEVLAPGTILW